MGSVNSAQSGYEEGLFLCKQKLTVDFCEGRKIAWCEPELSDDRFQIGG